MVQLEMCYDKKCSFHKWLNYNFMFFFFQGRLNFSILKTPNR